MDRCAHDLSAIGIPRFKKGAFHIRTSKLVVPRRLKYFSKKDSKLGAVDYGIALGSFFFEKFPSSVYFSLLLYM
jgi:hypothetical protein